MINNIRKMLRKLFSYRWIFRSLIKTVYFNFKCLPFKQAVHIPVILYKPKFKNLSGKFVIDSSDGIKMGLVKMGYPRVSIYDGTGVMIENLGVITFSGRCTMGAGIKISVGKEGRLDFGNNFMATAEMKIVCYDHIHFDDYVLVGWECLFMDTDLHQITIVGETERPKSHAPIFVGEHCWLACRCMIMKGTYIPTYSIVAANSFLNKDYTIDGDSSLFAGQPAKKVKSGMHFDWSISE